MSAEQQNLQQRLNFLGQVADATATPEVLAIVNSYLASWPDERIDTLQRLDGGWGPFDVSHKPAHIGSPVHLRCMRDAVHAQCIALREAHLTPSAELAELEAFFFIAHYRLEALGAEAMPRRAAVLQLAA
jgi:hypothetical protein